MNYYKNDKSLYFNDKAHIYRHQKEFDVLIVSPQAYDEIKKYDNKKDVILAEERNLTMSMIGKHNHISGNLAYEVGLQCGLDDESIRSAIKTFSGIEGRLEDMGLFRGVRLFNDNNATTGDATIAAISAINETYHVQPIIIMGGTDKGLPLESLEQFVEKNTKAYILLAGTGTDRLQLSKKHVYETLEECIEQAFTIAEVGDYIVFSPAFASFNKYFNNEYERNDLFVALLQKYR